MKLQHVTFIFCFLISVSALAQEPANRNYNTSDGLVSNNVYSVMQDRQGFIWFATDNGVSRFDGTHFRNYSLADGLSDNSVLRIEEDAEGRLWFLTFNGKLSFYRNDKIYNSSNTPFLKKLTFSDFITCFFQDSKKNIWICSMDNSIGELSTDGKIKIFKNVAKVLHMWENDGQLTFFSTKSVYFFKNDKFTSVVLPTAWAGGLVISKDSLLMLRVMGGFETYKINGQLRQLNNTAKYKYEIIKGLYADKNDIWLNTLSGALEFKNGILSPENERDYLKGVFITSVLRDKNANLWFSTFAKGVFVIPSTNIYLFDEKSGLVENAISAISLINDSSVLVGTNSGYIQLIKPASIKEFGRSLVPPTGRVLKIQKDKNGTIWILTEEAIYKYRNSVFTKLIDNNHMTWYKTLFISRDGTPWIGGGKEIKKIVNDNIIIAAFSDGVNRIRAIAQVKDNELLLGTDHGLYRFKDNKMIPYDNNNPLLTQRITALTLTKDSTLWLGTDANGLLSLKKGLVTSYTMKNHLLISDHCNDLFADGNKVYVATNNGLNVLNATKDSVHSFSYSTANGLVSNHINQVSKMGNSTIILATDLGLVEFDERKISTSAVSIPYINSFAVNDSLKALAPNYNFNYQENNIRIDFGAINFNPAGAIYYRYKLEGIDSKWNYTTYTSVKYSYLHPGNYKFIVSTQNADGTWNPNTATFSFFIATPWWHTWWFRSVAVLIISAALLLIIRWRFLAYKQKINRERAVAESELKALRAQINPHFIYNSLNAIQDFILQNQKEDANLYLSKFATLMRSILSHSRASTVPLEEEIASLRLYLELEALRFNNHFTFEFVVGDNIDAEFVHIPSMILQPYIENAVLHGLATLQGNGKLTISFRLENNFLVSTIEDNGIGRKRSAEARKQRVWKGHKSLGMTVTQERIDLLSSHKKQKINMQITDLAGDNNEALGTRVTIYFPLSL